MRLSASLFARSIIVLFFIATAASADSVRETGGEGFRIVKAWDSEGAYLRIEYYGWLAERCNAGRGSGHVNQLNFHVWLNGREARFQESQCSSYRDELGVLRRYAIVEVYSDYRHAGETGGMANPVFFEGMDHSRPWNLELYVQSVTGQYDSRYGRNYHYSL